MGDAGAAGVAIAAAIANAIKASGAIVVGLKLRPERDVYSTQSTPGFAKL
jgi:hypothetical protein